MTFHFGSKAIDTQPKDIIFPLIYVVLLFILGYFIWKLISPFLSIAVSGLLLYIHFLMDVFQGKE